MTTVILISFPRRVHWHTVSNQNLLREKESFGRSQVVFIFLGDCPELIESLFKIQDSFSKSMLQILPFLKSHRLGAKAILSRGETRQGLGQ